MMTLAKKNESMFPNLWNDMFENELFPFKQRKNGESSIPAVNIQENDKEYHLELAAPGMKKENINIDLDNDMLIISAENKSEETQTEKQGKVTRREFSYSNFRRSFTLPDNIEPDSISAKYVDGVLNIHVPKKQVETPESIKRIEIS